MKIEQKDNKLFFTFKNLSIRLHKLEENLYRIKIGEFETLESDEKEYCKNFFKEYCKRNSISIFTSENNIENKYLSDFGFQIFRSKTLYQKKLTKLETVDCKLTYKSISEVTLPVFLDTFTKAISDYEERDGLSEIEYFEFLKDLAEDKYNEDWWKLVLYKEEPIGVLMPQIYPDSDKVGTLFYLGLVKDFRNKGLGKEIHLEGLNSLYKLGATDYIGSTLNSNKAMNKVFEKNNCQVETIQNFFKTK